MCRLDGPTCVNSRKGLASLSRAVGSISSLESFAALSRMGSLGKDLATLESRTSVADLTIHDRGSRARAPCRRPLRAEDPRPSIHLERPNGVADGRHAQHVMPMGGGRVCQLKIRGSGDLNHINAVRRSRVSRGEHRRKVWAPPPVRARSFRCFRGGP